MNVMPRVVFPRYIKPLGAMFTGADLALRRSNILEIVFEIRCGPEKADLFYECSHCRGAGIETFLADRVEIPENIMEQMWTHAQLCEGVTEPVAH